MVMLRSSPDSSVSLLHFILTYFSLHLSMVMLHIWLVCVPVALLLLTYFSLRLSMVMLCSSSDSSLCPCCSLYKLTFHSAHQWWHCAHCLTRLCPRCTYSTNLFFTPLIIWLVCVSVALYINLLFTLLINGDATLIIRLVCVPVALLLDHVQSLLQLSQVHLEPEKNNEQKN